MKKEEFIERYGEEKYKEKIRKYSENRRKRHMGIGGSYPVDEVNFTADVIIGKDDESKSEQLRRLSDEEKLAGKIQRHLEGWWSRQTKKQKQFILIVDAGNKTKLGDSFKLKISLNQLRMSEETVKAFKTGAAAEILKYISEW